MKQGVASTRATVRMRDNVSIGNRQRHPMSLACEEEESDHSPAGRPRLDVDLDDVEFLCSLRLSLTRVAAIIGSTLYRRMIEEGRMIGGYSSISDADLDSMIQRIKIGHLLR